jgi:hypothetical protein
VFVCGGHDPRVESITSPTIAIPTSRRCWTFSPKSNTWTEIPGLRDPVSYASGAALDGLVYVTGGKGSDGRKRRSVQVSKMIQMLEIEAQYNYVNPV